MNVAFKETEKECDYFVIHDVDLLPNNPELRYDYPETVSLLRGRPSDMGLR